ncbi:MAG: hypothetical protein AABY16_04920 [Nanoarchaeota archaeon]
MDPETTHLLRKALEIAEENNKILKDLQSTARWSRFFFLVKWLVVIGITFGTYYFIQPYLNQILETYSGLKVQVDNLQKAGDGFPSLQEMFKKYQNDPN